MCIIKHHSKLNRMQCSDFPVRLVMYAFISFFFSTRLGHGGVTIWLQLPEVFGGQPQVLRKLFTAPGCLIVHLPFRSVDKPGSRRCGREGDQVRLCKQPLCLENGFLTSLRLLLSKDNWHFSHFRPHAWMLSSETL